MSTLLFRVPMTSNQDGLDSRIGRRPFSHNLHSMLIFEAQFEAVAERMPPHARSGGVADPGIAGEGIIPPSSCSCSPLSVRTAHLENSDPPPAVTFR